MDVEAASLSTDTLSMSCVLRNEMSSIGTPSTTISGLLLASLLNVPTPRMRKVGLPLMSPLLLMTDNPGTAPCKALATSCCGRPAIVFDKSTVLTAPVRLAFFCVP